MSAEIVVFVDVDYSDNGGSMPVDKCLGVMIRWLLNLKYCSMLSENHPFHTRTLIPSFCFAPSFLHVHSNVRHRHDDDDGDNNNNGDRLRHNVMGIDTN